MVGEWREARLSEVCKEIYRYPSFYGMEKHDHGVPVVRGEHLLPNGRISTDWSNYWFVSEQYARQFPKTRLARHDVVMSVRGSIGTFAQVGEEHVGAQLSPNLIRLSPDPDQIEPAFFYYALKGSAAQGFITSTSSSSAVPAIRASDIKLAEIPLPPLPEQRAIAHILGTLDDKIELNRRMSETLEAMARALFKSWFVDFDPVRAKAEGRDPGLPKPLADLFPARLVDSELGEIPEGWEVKVFADTVEIIGGGTPKTSVAEYWNGDVPWFSVVDAPPPSDVWVLDTEKKITHAGVKNSSARVLPAGTTIISARGTVGRLALVGVPMAMNQSCYGLRGKLGNRGFFNYFATRQLVSILQQRTHGSVFDTITRDTLAGVRVVAPPHAVVEAFEALVSPMLDRIREALAESRTLATLRDTLLPKLISGELRVRHAERFLKERGL